MFDRLLLAIDDSLGSEMATAFASAFAQRSGASVHVLHVNEYLVAGRGVTLHSNEEVRALLRSALTQLESADVVASGSSCVASYRAVASCIVEEARVRRADAIVLGSHRHRGFDRLFSSRVRERTTRLTSLPVLTAPAPLNISARSHVGVDELMRAEIERALSGQP
ncbi:MAG TPA: universal stress protein [Acidimicrobiales bacterium]|nr:universal stress protein [Acidimicrobiales bacterium]